LQVRNARLGVGVVVFIECIARRLRCLDKSTSDAMRLPHGPNMEGPALPAVRSILIAGFQLAKDRHDVTRGPCAHTRRVLCPAIEITRITTDVKHSVDTACATKHAATMQSFALSCTSRIRLTL